MLIVKKYVRYEVPPCPDSQSSNFSPQYSALSVENMLLTLASLSMSFCVALVNECSSPSVGLLLRRSCSHTTSSRTLIERSTASRLLIARHARRCVVHCTVSGSEDEELLFGVPRATAQPIGVILLGQFILVRILLSFHSSIPLSR